MEPKANEKQPLTPQEVQLLDIIHQTGYGELTIVVREGKPVHVHEIKKSIPLKG